jgi:hypothetical protein
MFDIIFLFLIYLLSVALGRKILKLFHIQKNSLLEISAIEGGLGLFFFSYLTFFLGVSGLLYKNLFYLIFLLLFIILRCEIKEIFLIFKKEILLKTNLSYNFFESFLRIILFLFILLQLIISLSPSTYWDELHYHLTVPDIYIRKHKIVYLPYILYSNFPLGLEMLYLLGMLIRGDVIPTLLHWLFSVLTILCIYLIALKFIKSFKVALLSGVIFYTLPVTGWLSNIAYVDLGFTFYTLLSFYFFLLYIFEKENKYLILSGIFCGVSLSIKHSGAILFFIYFIFLFLKAFFEKEKIFFPKIILFSLITILIPSPYYIKNYLFTGNPFYPFLGKYFGGIEKEISSSIWQGISGFGGMGKNIKNLLLLPYNLTIYGRYFSGIITPVFLVFLPFLLLEKKLEKIIKYLLFFSLIYSFIWFFTSQQTRFLLFPLALFSIISSYIFEKIKNFDKIIYFFFKFLLIFTFIFSFYFLISNQELRIPTALGFIPKDFYLSKTLETYDACKYINKFLREDAKILFLNDNRIYYCKKDIVMLQKNYFSDEFSSERRYRELKKHNISYLLYNALLSLYTPSYPSVLMKDLKGGYLIPVFEKNKVFIFKVRYK